MSQDSIRVLQTVEHPCGYYPERLARNLVIDPNAERQDDLYDALASSGFRRAGNHIFRPHCRRCTECIATRIPTTQFTPNRSQKRCLKRNSDLVVTQEPASYNSEYFQLYQRYLGQRHPDGGMDNPDPEDFKSYLLSNWARTSFLELRLNGALVGLAVTDVLNNGLGSVYTFYDPEESNRSLGTFAILQQIELARDMSLPYVYLGYWINGHPKMDYKRKYSGIQGFKGRSWDCLD